MTVQLNLRSTIGLLVHSMLLVLAAVPFVCGQQNPIQAENALQGTSDWKITTNPSYDGTIEGYASATSVNIGERSLFM